MEKTPVQACGITQRTTGGGGIVLARLCAWVVVMCTPSVALAERHRSIDWPAVYTLDRMLTFYIVNDEPQDFTVTLRWLDGWQAQMDTPLLVRVLDPTESTLVRHLEPAAKSASAGWNECIVPVSATTAGVYQVIVTGFGGTVHFELSPDMSWGVYGYPFLRGANHVTDAYVYLPPGLSSLSAQCEGTVSYVRLTDENDVTHLNLGQRRFRRLVRRCADHRVSG
jgi:hypothetical protein